MKRIGVCIHRPLRHAIFCLGAVLVAAVVGVVAQTPSPSVRVFDANGDAVEPLAASGARAIVFVFTATDCPISNRYAPEVRGLYERFAPRGVAFWLVYADPSDSAEAIQRHIQEFDYPLTPLRDSQHALVKLTGVRVTPEAAVLVPGAGGPRLVYRGRIDDLYVDFGKARAKPTTRDLERVLETILAGTTPRLQTTPAVGCFIPKLP